jgi:hypothetical protein
MQDGWAGAVQKKILEDFDLEVSAERGQLFRC